MKKWEVIYTLKIEVNGEDENEAQYNACEELEDLLKSYEDDPLFLTAALVREPRTINEII